MFSVFPAISASTKRLIILTAASALLLAAGNVPQADAEIASESDPAISDAILAPMSPADTAAATAALAATTPAEIAAAARANAPVAAAFATAAADAAVTAVETAPAARPAKLTTLVSSLNEDEAALAKNAELRCLATAVYFEARGEPLEGQLAVAQAILNRVASGRYAATVCGVINQPRQFSFDRTRTPRAGTDWTKAKAIARVAMHDMWDAVAPEAMSFHATYVSPNWRGKTRVAQIGRHVFYK
jgi:N-acetylmuramoyl-L-alanine amidase